MYTSAELLYGNQQTDSWFKFRKKALYSSTKVAPLILPSSNCYYSRGILYKILKEGYKTNVPKSLVEHGVYFEGIILERAEKELVKLGYLSYCYNIGNISSGISRIQKTIDFGGLSASPDFIITDFINNETVLGEIKAICYSKYVEPKPQYVIQMEIAQRVFNIKKTLFIIGIVDNIKKPLKERKLTKLYIYEYYSTDALWMLIQNKCLSFYINHIKPGSPPPNNYNTMTPKSKLFKNYKLLYVIHV